MNNERKNVRGIVKDVLFFVVLVATAVACIMVKYMSEQEQTEIQKNSTEVVVGIHIKGEVKNPGYYELEYGSRIKDAIAVSGGATDNADINAVNLAEKLSDGEEIKIPAKGEIAKTTENGKGKININTASKNDFVSLYGIGDVLAEQIVSYREQNGKFKNINDLKKINGISSSKFEKFRDDITV